MNLNQRVLFSLIRRALWGIGEIVDIPDIKCVATEARKQGVQSFLFSAAKSHGELFSLETRREWRSIMLACALHNDEINAAQVAIIEWLSVSGIRAVVIKGLSATRYYPQHEVRALGDIDMLVSPEYVVFVDSILQDRGYIGSNSSHIFHRRYHQNEVHQAVTDVPESKGGRAVKTIAQSFLDDVEHVEICGMKFSVLSEPHHALMLLLHMEHHMFETGIGLRQLCDWSVYINSVNAEVWRTTTSKLLAQCGLLFFAQATTKVCVVHLGLDADKFQWCMDVNDEFIDDLITDVFPKGNLGGNNHCDVSGVFTDRRTLGQAPKGRIRGLISKLTSITYKRYPIVREHQAMLPVIYICVRYLVKNMFRAGDSTSLLQVITDSNGRHELCRALKLYEVK